MRLLLAKLFLFRSMMQWCSVVDWYMSRYCVHPNRILTRKGVHFVYTFLKYLEVRPRRLVSVPHCVEKTHGWDFWKSVQSGVHLFDQTTYVWRTVLSVKFPSSPPQAQAAICFARPHRCKIVARLKTHQRAY